MRIYKLFLPLIFVVAIMLPACVNKQDFILHSNKVKVYEHDEVLYRCSHSGPTKLAAGEKLEYEIEFVIGTRDEAGTENPDKLIHPPTPEEAEEIKKEAYNANLLIKQGEKIIQAFPLSDYKPK